MQQFTLFFFENIKPFHIMCMCYFNFLAITIPNLLQNSIIIDKAYGFNLLN